MINKIISILLGTFAGISVTFLILHYSDAAYKYDFYQKEYNYYTNTFRHHQGWIRLGVTNETGISYNLMSFDAGGHWYSVSNNGNGNEIIGKADPELVTRLEDVNSLVRYAQTHGPITSISDVATIQRLQKLEVVIVHDGAIIAPTNK